MWGGGTEPFIFVLEDKNLLEAEHFLHALIGMTAQVVMGCRNVYERGSYSHLQCVHELLMFSTW